MSIIDKYLVKEAFEPPLESQLRFLAMIQQPFGIPREPSLTKEAAIGLIKVARILKTATSEEEAAVQLERQAMTDPTIQVALDYQQAQNEREQALAQVEQMNQQLFEAQSAQAAAEQQVQQASQQMEQMGQQAAQLQEQLNQEQMMRQEAQTQLVAARDQSLQEQISAQEQKAQMNQSAEVFRQQADMLAQQIKAMAMQPTGQQAMMAPGGQPGDPGGGGGFPPPMTAEAAKQQQEAINAEQHAAVQGGQAQVATEEDLAKQEQIAAMQGGQPQPGSQEEQAMMAQQGEMPPEAMPKQGSVTARYQRVMTKMAARNSVNRGLVLEKTASAKDVLKSILARKGIGVGVGAGLGAGYGAAEIGRDRLAGEGPTGKMVDLQTEVDMAKIKAEADPTFLNKLKALKAETALKTENVLSEHPGGRMAWRAGQGAVLGGASETAVRNLAKPVGAYGSALLSGLKRTRG